MKSLVVYTGITHCGKVLLSSFFDRHRDLGVSTEFLWSNDLVCRFFKENFNIELLNSARVGKTAPQLDGIVFQHFTRSSRLLNHINLEGDNRFYLTMVSHNFIHPITTLLNGRGIPYIVIVRDLRAIWTIYDSEEKYTESHDERLFKEFDDFFICYKEIISKRPNHIVIKFEDLNSKYDQIFRTKIFPFLYVNKRVDNLYRISEYANRYFTSFDVEKNKNFGLKDQNKLDEISEKYSEYNNVFGYKEYLTVDELYEGL